VLVLLGIGFLAGVITAVSPCILPVLPIVLAGGASGEGRRPLAIIAGLVVSFTVFTLTAASILSALGLPQDVLRNLAIATLFVLAASLLFPQVAYWLERPFAFMTRRRGGDLGGGLVLGVSLGLVFVPCAGPVLATITALSAQHRIGFETVFLTIAYAVGAAVPMLLIALGGQRVARRLRAQSRNFRRAMGVLLAGAALAIVFNTAQSLQTALGGYTTSIQKHVEETSLAQKHLDSLRGGSNAFATAAAKAASPPKSALPVLGTAPDFVGISHWLNTPGDRRESLASLRGKVVLVDFWTYSCINCLRTLPYLKAWDMRYRSKGLVILGVHTPEFAFEHDLGNVRAAVKRLGVDYPVALDNSYGTWKAYSNQYWPADYLVDQAGRVRDVHFGEGEYAKTERDIRLLLAAGKAGPLPQAGRDTDRTPLELRTPESYLGYLRIGNYTGSPLRTDRLATYRFPASLTQDSYAYAGKWKVEGERIVAGDNARLRLHFQARTVHLVLTGRGFVAVKVNGKPQPTVRVDGDRLYTLVTQKSAADGALELSFTPGLAAYAFTFG